MDKAFPSDRNYMLHEAQVQLKGTFPFDLHNVIKSSFVTHCNPLGIVDDTVRKITEYIPGDADNIGGFYDNLSIAYRYKYGDNQLEIVWDGRSQVDHYMDQWRAGYKSWLSEMCADTNFLRLLLILTVFRSSDKNYTILENRLKGAVNKSFDVKIRNLKLLAA